MQNLKELKVRPIFVKDSLMDQLFPDIRPINPKGGKFKSRKGFIKRVLHEVVKYPGQKIWLDATCGLALTELAIHQLSRLTEKDLPKGLTLKECMCNPTGGHMIYSNLLVKTGRLLRDKFQIEIAHQCIEGSFQKIANMSSLETKKRKYKKFNKALLEEARKHFLS